MSDSIITLTRYPTDFETICDILTKRGIAYQVQKRKKYTDGQFTDTPGMVIFLESKTKGVEGYTNFQSDWVFNEVGELEGIDIYE